MARSISFDMPGMQAAAPEDDLERISMRRKLAEALMAKGADAAPVGHWTQALARALQGVGGYMQMRQANDADSKLRAQANEALMGLIKPQAQPPMTGGPSAAAAPPRAAMEMAGDAPPQQPMTPEEQGVAKFAQPALAASIPKVAAAMGGEPMQNRGLTSYAGMSPGAAKVAGAFNPSTVVLHDYGGNPKNEDGVFNPYNALVFPDGSVRYRDPKNPYGSKAPHAYRMNGESVGISYAGPVGSQPTPEALKALQGEYAKVREMYPDIKAMSHGEAYEATKGTSRQASRLGRGLDEASWRDAVRNGAPTTGNQPVQVADASGGPDPATLQRMLANPYTRDMAQKLIMQQMKPENAAEYGLNPQYARDAQGNVVPYVMGKDGRPKMIELPGGAKALAPADIAEQKTVGREMGELKAAMPKVEMAYKMFDTKSNRLIGTIDRAMSRIGPNTTGFGALLAALPETDARALRGDLETIRANLGFAELEAMRASSPTGGALGNVTEREQVLLQSVTSAIDQLMSGGDLKQNLGIIKQSISDLRQMKSMFLDLDRQRAGLPPMQAVQPQNARGGGAAPGAGGGGWKIERVD